MGMVRDGAWHGVAHGVAHGAAGCMVCMVLFGMGVRVQMV